MKNIKKLLLIVLLSFLSLITLNNVKAEETTPYLVTTNPGENASTMMNINYHTDLSVKSSKVIYTTKDDIAWTNQKEAIAISEFSDIYSGKHSNGSLIGQLPDEVEILRWKVTLMNLTPDTNYMYYVYGDEDNLYYFKTAGAEEFSFAWISDFHTYSPLQGRLTSAVDMISTLVKHDPFIDFVFSTGDDVAYGNCYSFWTDLYATNHNKNYMWASTIGNHDHMNNSNNNNKNDYFKEAHNFPENGYEGEVGVSYYFIYGNTLFLVLNNETLKNTGEAEKAIAWMRDVINNNKTQYIIVSEHYQWFNGVTGQTSNITRFSDFFDEVGVDLAISGNNHIYVRTKPLYNGKASTDPELGTTYIQAPSSDNERGQAMNETLTYNKDIIEVRYSQGTNTIGGSVVSVSENGIRVKLLDRDGTVIDNILIKPKRLNYDMSGFDKENFIKNISYKQSDFLDTAVNFNFPDSPYILSIQILDNDNKVIGLSSGGFITVNGFSKNEKKAVKVVLKFQDLSKEVLTYNVILDDSALDVEYLKIVADKFELKYQAKEDCSYKIYFDNNLYLETSENVVSIDKNAYENNALVKVECLKDNEVVSFGFIRYAVYGDVNLDGVINDTDVIVIQNSLLGKEAFVYDALADLNYDNEVNLIDATIIMLHLKNKKEISKKEYNVTYIYKDKTEVLKVEEGKIPLLPDVSGVGGYSGYLGAVYQDTNIYANYESNVRRVTVNGSKNGIVGQTQLLTVSITPEGALIDVIWASSDDSIATVSKEGLVTYLKKGTVTITATSIASTDKSGTIVITVKE